MVCLDPTAKCCVAGRRGACGRRSAVVARPLVGVAVSSLGICIK